MRILYINHYAGSTRHGMAFRPYYLAREWVRVGHEVTIVAASFSHIRSSQPTVHGRSRTERIDGIDYQWWATPSYRGNGIGRVRNILSFLWALWRNARRYATEYKPDVVIASSTYPMDIWPASRIATLAQATLVFEVHDLWPLSPMELGGMPKWHPFIVWVQAAEDYAYRNADKVVSMLPKAEDYMRSRGMRERRFVYVPNGVDEREWVSPPDLGCEIKERLTAIRAKGHSIVGYTGSIGLANALDVLLDAAYHFRNKAHVIIVGSGPDHDRLQRRVEQERLENVSFFPPISKASIPNFLAEVDVAYIGFRPTALYRFGISPNKVMDYMMAGRPVVMAIDAGSNLVEEAGCGITVPPGNPAAVAKAVLALAGKPTSEREAIGAAGKEFIMKNHVYRVLAQHFLDSVSR